MKFYNREVELSSLATTAERAKTKAQLGAYQIEYKGPSIEDM